MRFGIMLLGILMLLGGLVWVSQGLNLPFAPRSFMTANRAWIVIGVLVAVAGVVVIDWGRRRQ